MPTSVWAIPCFPPAHFTKGRAVRWLMPKCYSYSVFQQRQSWEKAGMPPQKDKRCMTFGRTVRRYRRDKGLTQEELADQTGIHRTYIGGIERGERNPTLLMIHRIADALGVSPARLLEEEGT